MINKLKENKLRTACIGISLFLFGFITVTLFNNINDTYAAVDTSPVCPVSWVLSNNMCCPAGFTYYESTSYIPNACIKAPVTESDCQNNYSSYNPIAVDNKCIINSVQPEAPACYACGTSSQGASYVWGNYSKSSSCTKTSYTYDNCKEPENACYYCPTSNNYTWTTSKPTSTCSTTGWQLRSDITTQSACKAPSCYYCPTSDEYSWSTNAPASTCSTTGWQLRSDLTSSTACSRASNPKKYTATFYPNGGTFSTGKSFYDKVVTEGETNYFSDIGIPTVTKSNCTLDGWHVGSTSGTVYRQYFSIDKNTDFYANWSCSSSGGGETPTPTTYTVTYNANGGTGAPSNQTKKQGENLTISTTKPTKTGYTFTSWNTKADGTGTKYDIGATYTADANITLYAQYKENTVTYTIKYDANDGTGAPEEQTKTKGKELVLSTTEPTKEGYKFVNWNTKKDGTGESYKAGAKYTKDGNVTLYAQYEKELNENETKYTITFYMNDGTNEKNTKVVNKGDKVVKPEAPSREGYTFDGWYDKKEDGKEYDFTKEVTSDISLYAYWTKEGDKTSEEISKNSGTGDALIFIAWTIGIGALAYAVYYYRSKKETI